MSSPSTSYDPLRFPAIKKIRFLGSGSYGVVHLAYFEGHKNAKFAMKSAEDGDDDARSLAKEKRVYESLAGCPGITRYFMDATTEDPDDGLTYYSLLLDYALMGSLDELIRLRKGRAFPERRVKVYARKILVGLCSLHSKGYVHCDLKPANILAFPSPEGPGTPYDLKLADFGLAEEPHDPVPREFSKGKFRGTPNYMSPESVTDGLISWRLDIWSFGCVILQMLNGWEAPWPTSIDYMSVGEFVDLLKDPNFDPLASMPQSTSEPGKSFLRKCLNKDHLKRWSAHQLLDHPYVAIAASNAAQPDDALSSEMSSLSL